MSDNIGKEFMRRTRYSEMGESPQRQGIPQPPLETNYPMDASLVPLPEAVDLNFPAHDLRAAIEKRTSVRNYSDTPLTLEELSALLWLTQGVKEVTHRPVTLRTVPSAGARHAFETYLLIIRVETLTPGLYRYVALEHALLPVRLDAEVNQELTQACLKQQQVQTSAVTFIWVAVVERMYWRYLERGYRYLHLDAGHICQNLYLAAEPIGCGVCAIAAFDDDAVNAFLGIDGVEQFAIYLASLGKKAGC